MLLLGKPGYRRINKIISGDVDISEEVEAFTMQVSKHMLPVTEQLPIFTDQQIRSISSPVLYVGGTKDALLNTMATNKRSRSLLPEATSIILEGAPHVILDQGELIKKFLLRR